MKLIALKKIRKRSPEFFFSFQLSATDDDRITSLWHYWTAVRRYIYMTKYILHIHTFLYLHRYMQVKLLKNGSVPRHGFLFLKMQPGHYYCDDSTLPPMDLSKLHRVHRPTMYHPSSPLHNLLKSHTHGSCNALCARPPPLTPLNSPPPSLHIRKWHSKSPVSHIIPQSHDHLRRV